MIKIKSFAKVNLFLKVTRKFKTYHKLYSLITQIDLFDEITIKETKSKKSEFYFFGPYKIISKNNTIENLLRILKINFPKLENKNFNFYIKKKIPNGSGLGGASSNAAAVFKYLKKKYKLNISYKKSLEILGQVGKDCPLFINNNIKLIDSTGDKFQEFKNKIKLNLLIIHPNINLSTKKVFNRVSRISKIKYKKNINLSNKDSLLDLCKFYGNDLMLPASKLTSKIKNLIKILQEYNESIFYSMTGSGSAFFVISNSKKSLLNIKKIIKKQNKSYWTTIVNTI